MAITFPRTDIITSVGYTDQTFMLMSRQEISGQANGVLRGKDLGSALWTASYTTIELLNADAIAFEAALNSLDGLTNAFEAGDLRNRYPRNYPTGSFTDSGVLATVGSNNKSLSISGLPANFVISAGDYFHFTYSTSRALHQAVETVTASGAGLSPVFEVRPFIRPGYTISNAVTFKLPNGQFILQPNSISTTLKSMVSSAVSFKAMQYLA
jgi:hypothetical protein